MATGVKEISLLRLHGSLEIWPETPIPPASRYFLGVDRCNGGALKRIAYTITPYTTAIRLLGVCKTRPMAFRPASVLRTTVGSSSVGTAAGINEAGQCHAPAFEFQRTGPRIGARLRMFGRREAQGSQSLSAKRFPHKRSRSESMIGPKYDRSRLGVRFPAVPAGAWAR